MMRYILRTVKVVLVLTLLAAQYACVEEAPKILEKTVVSVKPASLKLSTNSISFSTSREISQTITVSSTNVPWEFADVPDWITVSPMSSQGNSFEEVVITCKENTSVTDRVGVFKFRSKDVQWNYLTTFTVTQARGKLYAYPDSNTIDFDGASGSKELKVVSNTDNWSVSLSKSLSSWCTATKVTDGVTITVKANPGATSRSGDLYITTDDTEQTVTVVQRPANVVFSVDTVEVEVNGGSKNVQFTAEASWTAETSYSWIDFDPGSGDAGNSTITVITTPNISMTPRIGYVYIVLSDDNKVEIPIRQDGIMVSVDYDESKLPNTGADMSVSVKSNSTWAFTGEIPDWIKLDTLPNTGDKTVTVSVSPNTGIDDRSATLYITPTQVTNLIPVIVNQRGITLESDSVALHFSDKAGEAVITLNADVSWTAESSEPWITLSKNSGSGTSLITVSVTENESDATRTGLITVSTTGRYTVIPVYQVGKYLNVSSDALEFTSKGGTTTVSLKSNNSWKAACADSWITLSDTSGTNDCNLDITVTDNPSAAGRNGNVVITPDGFNPISINIAQAARYLTLSTEAVEFFSKGGTSAPVTVSTDGEYEIVTDADWLTINQESDNEFTITAALYDDDYYDRTGIVTIRLTDLTSGSLTKDIIVTQQNSGTHHYVDLGLSVLWAECNVGAEKPQDYGQYYAWGETTYKSEYYWYNYSFGSNNSEIVTKYCTDKTYGFNGFVDNKTVLEPDDDVAHVEWGSDWRMPTYEEQTELYNNCDWEWTAQNGIKGYKVTSKVRGFEGRSIFLPASGYFLYEVYSREEHGGYWSSSLAPDNRYAYQIYFYTTYFYVSTSSRYEGGSVRPVRTYREASFTDIEIDVNDFKVAKGCQSEIHAIGIRNNGTQSVIKGVTWTSSDPTIATVADGIVTGKTAGSCTITASLGSFSATCSVNVIDPNTVIRQSVDLGLSVKWATLNVGAISPEMPGDYYAWGEIDTYYQNGQGALTYPSWKNENRDGYGWNSYRYCYNGSSSNLLKYCNNVGFGYGGYEDNLTVLEPTDDVAKVKWGGNWRTPTKAEFNELRSNCKWVWTTLNGVNGYLVTSNKTGYTDRSIFLPVTGYYSANQLYNKDDYGSYWTADLYNSDPRYANSLRFNSSQRYTETFDRCWGLTIRPVCDY